MTLLNQNMPKTYFRYKAEDLVDGAGWIRAKPYYPVPDSPGSVRHEESEWTYAAYVVGVNGDLVRVCFDWPTVPGKREQLFSPHELHLGSCICRACAGDNLSFYLWQSS